MSSLYIGKTYLGVLVITIDRFDNAHVLSACISKDLDGKCGDKVWGEVNPVNRSGRGGSLDWMKIAYNDDEHEVN
jgi:hypothetical protein